MIFVLVFAVFHPAFSKDAEVQTGEEYMSLPCRSEYFSSFYPECSLHPWGETMVVVRGFCRVPPPRRVSCPSALHSGLDLEYLLRGT